MRRLLVPVFVVLTSALARAEPPNVSHIFPAGAQRGTAVDVRVGGFYLHGRASFHVAGEKIKATPEVIAVENFWIEGPMILKPDSQQKEDYPKDHGGQITVAADALPGVRHWHCRTSQGTTPTMKFVVGDLPETIEREIDGAPIPETVALPVTINGRIFPREDVDLWKFRAEAGQMISCLLASRSLGYPLDAHVEIIGPGGGLVRGVRRDIDSAGDPTVTFRTKETGEYTVKLHDGGFAGGPHLVYRLTIRSGPRLESVFPLGGRRGETTGIRVNGTETVEVAMPAAGDALAQRFGELGTAALHVADLPELRAPGPFTLPAMLNGCIDAPRKAETWTIDLKKGQGIALEVLARRLGTKLDSVMTLCDAAGAELTRNDDRAAGEADSALLYTAPKDGTYQVRITDRFSTRGGPQFGYRVRATPLEGADFELTLSADFVNVTRQTEAEAAAPAAKPKAPPKGAALRVTLTPLGEVNKEVKLEAIGLPDGVTLETPLLNPRQKFVDLRFAASPRAKIQVAEITIRGTTEINGRSVTRDAVFSTAFGEPAAERVRLAIAPAVPFRHVGEYWVTNDQPSGTTLSKHYRLERDGFDGPITVSLADRQGRCLQGVTGAPLVIPPGATEFTYTALFPPDLELGRTNRLQLMLVGEITDFDGTRHTVSHTSFEQNEQMISVVTEGLLKLTPAKSSLLFQPGSRVALPFTLRRSAAVARRPLRVSLKVPPHITGVAAAPVLLSDGASEGIITLAFAPNAGPFNMPLTLLAETADQEAPPHHTWVRIEVVSAAVATAR